MSHDHTITWLPGVRLFVPVACPGGFVVGKLKLAWKAVSTNVSGTIPAATVKLPVSVKVEPPGVNGPKPTSPLAWKLNVPVLQLPCGTTLPPFTVVTANPT